MTWGSARGREVVTVRGPGWRPAGAAEPGCAPLGWHGPQVAAREDNWADEPRQRPSACAGGGMDQGSEAVERPAAQHRSRELRQTGGGFQSLVQDHAAHPADAITDLEADSVEFPGDVG